MLKHARTRPPQAQQRQQQQEVEAGAKSQVMAGQDENTPILDKRGGNDSGRKVPDRSSVVEEYNSSMGNDVAQLVSDCQDDKPEGSSISATVFNYVNSVIGSGIIGMAYAMKQSGLVLGLVSLCLVAVLTDYSLILLVKNGNLSGTSTYQDMLQAAFGMPGYFLLTLFQFSYPFIAMVSYNVIVSDTVTTVFVRVTGVDPLSIVASREFVVAVTTLLVTLPLSLYRDIGKLAKVSFLSLIFVFFILVSIYIRFFTMAGDIPTTDESLVLFNPGSYSKSVAIMTFAFMCHHNSFLLYSAIEDTSQQKWNKVTHVSIFSSFVVLLTCAVGGYITFLDFTQGDLLNNYCWGDDLMNVCRLLFSITILLTYPIECFICREVIENIIFTQLGFFSEKFNRESWISHVSITVVVVVITCFVSLSTNCLGIVLILNGLLFAIPLAFILPGVCYLKLSYEGSHITKERLPAICIVLFGITVSVNGIVMLFLDHEPMRCTHNEEMPYCIESIKNISRLSFQSLSPEGP